LSLKNTVQNVENTLCIKKQNYNKKIKSPSSTGGLYFFRETYFMGGTNYVKILDLFEFSMARSKKS
jgi:hypothetical protein